MKTSLLVSCFVIFFQCVHAASVDTAITHSRVMNKDIKCIVIKPSSYDGRKHLPVVYLLHGHSGNFTDWITRVPAIKQYADKDSIIIVCPDGNYNSWYLDAPVDPSIRYETYISK